jgi:hypothetical protein
MTNKIKVRPCNLYKADKVREIAQSRVDRLLMNNHNKMFILYLKNRAEEELVMRNK